jgi:hypothetical protein
MLVYRITGKPIWIWDLVRQAVDTPNFVYFPQAYTDRNQEIGGEELEQGGTAVTNGSARESEI